MQEKKYFQDHRKVLIAVSGGLDSMTLLQLLIDSQKELAIELASCSCQSQTAARVRTRRKGISKDCGTAWCKDFYIKFFW